MKRLTTDEFITKARIVHGDTYSYINTVYTKAATKVVISCITHGDFLQRPNDHISGRSGCPKCKAVKIGDTKRKSHISVISSFENIHGDTYDYSNVSYTNMKRKVTVICKKHGRFSISPEKHLLGRGCQECNMSSGEAMVAQCLASLGLEYERQKIFENLKVISHLKFDFYLPKLNALIEYDGAQHSMLSSVFRNATSTNDEIVERFLKTIEYDCHKNIFANNERMYLLRIPYTANSHNIKNILEHFVETVEADPMNLDSSGSYVIS